MSMSTKGQVDFSVTQGVLIVLVIISLVGSWMAYGASEQVSEINKSVEELKTNQEDIISQIGGGGEEEYKAPVLSVGVIEPFTADYAWIGRNIMEGAKVSADQLVDLGVFKDVKFHTGDTQFKPAQARTAMNKVSAKESDFIIGPSSGGTPSVVPKLIDKKILFLQPGGGTIILNDIGGTYQYRTLPSDLHWAAAIGLFAKYKKYNGVADFEKVAFVCGDAPGLAGFKPVTEATFEKGMEGLEMVSSKKVTVGQPSYGTVVNDMMAEDPGCILVCLSPSDTATFVSNARAAGFEGPIVGPDELTGGTFQQMISESEIKNTFACASGLYNEKKMTWLEGVIGHERKFCNGYAWDAMTVGGLASYASYLETGDMNATDAADYVRPICKPPGEKVSSVERAVSLIREACKKGGVDELDKAIDFQGLASPLDFNKFGDIASPYYVKKWSTGEGKWTRSATIPVEEIMPIIENAAEKGLPTIG